MATEQRLIDVDAAIERAKQSDKIVRSSIWETDEVVEFLEGEPTIDARPVVHGEWEQLGGADYRCSLCGFRFTSGDPIEMFGYCRCGAQMDGGADNG